MAVAVLVGVVAPAAAAPRPSGTVRPGAIEVRLQGDARPGRPGSTSTGRARYRCAHYADHDGTATGQRISRETVPPGGAYWRRCTEVATGRVGSLRRFVVPGGPGADGFEARLPVPLPPPAVAASPRLGVGSVVGLETWWWLEEWSPVTAPLTRDGATVIAVGVPKEVRWRFTDPDGTTVEVRCEGPGRPYGSEGAEAAAPCTHRFEQAGVHRVSAELRWEVGWVATTGASEELGSTTTTAEVLVAVRELDTVIGP